MKKVMMILTAVVLLLTTVGCSAFNGNINKYIEMADYENLTVKKADVEDDLKDVLDSALKQFRDITELTEGTVEDGDITYIYYDGRLVLYKGEYTFEVGKCDIPELDKALEDGEFKDGVFTSTLKLSSDFVMPAFVAEAKKNAGKTEEPTTPESTVTPAAETPAEDAAPADGEAVDEAASETPATEEPTPATETPAEETETPAPAEPSYYAGRETVVTLTVEGKEGKVAEGDKLTGTLKWTCSSEGMAYTAETAAEKNKTDADKKGSELEIGSDSMIDGFEDAIIGMSVVPGTKKTIDVTFPDPYTQNTDISGEDAEFDIEICSVSRPRNRDLDNAEDFAAFKADYEKVNGEGSFDYADAKAFRDAQRETAKAQLAADVVVSAAKVKKWKYSDLEDYKNRTLASAASYYAQITGQYPDAQTVLSAFFGGSEQTLTNQAGASLKNDLVLFQVAKDQGLDKVTKSEYNEFLDDQVKEYNAYYAANPASDGTVQTISAKDLVKNVYGSKADVKKSIVLQRAQEWLGKNFKEA